MNTYIRISNSLSFFFKYVFPYLYLLITTTGLIYFGVVNEELVFGAAFGIMFLVALIQLLIFTKISTYVYLDRENHSIAAYNRPNGARRLYPLDDLWRVRTFRSYTLLVFKGKAKLFYLSKSSFPLLEEDGENYISSLRKRAKNNRRNAQANWAQSNG